MTIQMEHGCIYKTASRHTSAFQRIGDYCEKHWNSMNKHKIIESIDWTEKMQDLYNNNNMNQLRQLLRDNNMKVSGNKRELVIRILSKK